MRAVVCSKHGPLDRLVVKEVDDPVPGEGEVVVDISYAAVNFPDVLIIEDRYQVSAPVPFIPGSEFAGVVTEAGSGVDDLVVGTNVLGTAMTGAFAERIAVPDAAVRLIPDGVGLKEAAAFWVAHATAYHSLRSVAELAPGERVVVLGAGGGVGLAAVELATVMGGQVIAAASTDVKLAVCQQRGATALVNYRQRNLREALRELAPDGVDVVIDPVGGPLAEQGLRALRWNGRFVTLGYASGEIPRIPLNLVLLKGCVVRGFEARTFEVQSPQLAARDRGELLELLRSRAVAAHVSAVHDLARAADALRFVQSRASTGKVLVQTRSVAGRDPESGY